ncbi:MAG: VOC family protein [Candidatus Poribacteria bacterium]|nr:VOC family protein [Candidatus Poribacteria bacterium]
MSDTVVYFEMETRDVNAQSAFYHTLFGWEYDHMPEWDYFMMKPVNGGIGCGFFSKEDATPRIVPYIQVADVQAALDRIERRGGKMTAPPKESGGVRIIAFFQDPNGIDLGLVQQLAHDTHTKSEKQSMAKPVIHFELAVKDAEQSVKFYSEVFDWKTQHYAEMNYYPVDSSGEHAIGGGIHSNSPHPFATVYTDVDDIQKYLDKAVELGGTVLMGVMPVGDMGELGMFADPEGNVMGLWKTN